MRLISLKSAMTSMFAASGLFLASLTFAHAQSSDSNSALMARQQMRLNTIEDNLKTVRGTLETEFRAIRLQIEKMAEEGAQSSDSYAAKLKELKGQIIELGDTLDIFNQRLRRSIELSSDVEFRVLRLEKRMQTLLSMSGDSMTNAILQDDVNAAGVAPTVSMSRDNDTGGGTWTVEKDDDLNAELDKLADNQSAISEDNQTALVSKDADNRSDQQELSTTGGSEEGEAVAEQDDASANDDPIEAPVIETVLPDGSPEEQYRFAFGRMLQNDLETAEKGFTEFRELYPDNERSADVLYWLGRVQFIQGDYGKSAMSFTEFNSAYPEDSRLPEAILMIAESVLNFATAEQACQIFADLPQMLDQPGAEFVKRLDELKVAASCAG